MKLIRRGLIPAVGAVLVAVVLSACGGPGAASSAAIVGQQAVPNSTLDTYVSDLHRAKKEPVDQADLELTQAVLNRLILESLIDQTAERLQLEVTDAEIQQRIAKAEESLGGREKLEAALLESQIPPSGMNAAFRLAAALEKIGAALLPDGSKDAQSQAVYDYVFNLAKEIGVSLNPRYGTWDTEALQVGPLPTDLSTPAAK